MQVILLATGESSKLRPLTEDIPSPMISVANRPMMVYTVEMLARQGIKDFIASLNHLAGSIEAYFGDGRRWGVSIEYVLQKEAWGSAGALKWAEGSINDTFLVIPGDILIDINVEAILAQHKRRQSKATVVLHSSEHGPPLILENDGKVKLPYNYATSENCLYNTGIFILEPDILKLIPTRTVFDLNEQLLPLLLQENLPVHGCQVNGFWNNLSTFQDYQAAQEAYLLSLGDNRLFNSSVKALEARQYSPGIWVGRNQIIHPSARLAPPVYIGDNCQIGKEVELGPNVLIGKNVVIDDEATVCQSTILDYTYVGQLVNIENRIVNKNHVIDIASSEKTKITDEFLLGEAHPAFIGTSFSRIWTTTVAFILLILTLPLTIPIGLVTLLTYGRIFERIQYIGRRAKIFINDRTEVPVTYKMLRFCTHHRTGERSRLGNWLNKLEFSRLPELWNVLIGDINLVGVKPLVLVEVANITEAWQQERQYHPSGFTGLWYLQTDDKSELDEVLITDTYYVTTRNWREDLSIIWKTPGRWLTMVTSA